MRDKDQEINLHGQETKVEQALFSSSSSRHEIAKNQFNGEEKPDLLVARVF